MTFKALLLFALAIGFVKSGRAEPAVRPNDKRYEALARERITAAHPGMSSDNLELLTVSYPKEPAPNPEQANSYIRVSFRLKDTVREERLDDLMLTRFESIRIAMDWDGNLPRWERVERLPTLTAKAMTPPDADVVGQKTIMLNFRNSPLKHVLEFYGKLKGQRVEPPDVTWTPITCLSDGRLTVPQTLKLIDRVLADQNLAVVESEDGTLRVVAGSRVAE